MRLPEFPSFRRPEPTQEPSAAQMPIAVTYLNPDFLIRMAEDVWRLRRRTDRTARTIGEDALKAVRDAVARLEDTLASNDIRLEDYSGQPYFEGLRLDIAFVEGDVMADDPLWVVETVKPTVLLGNRVLSTGQVILANRPPEAERQ